MLSLVVFIFFITIIQASLLENAGSIFVLIPMPLIFIYLWQYAVNNKDSVLLISSYIFAMILLRFNLAIIASYSLISIITGLLVHLVLAQKSLYGYLSGATIVFLLNLVLISIFSRTALSFYSYPVFLIISYASFIIVVRIVKNRSLYG